jgi:hypothetical protein
VCQLWLHLLWTCLALQGKLSILTKHYPSSSYISMAGTWKKLARVQKWFREPAKVWGIGGKEHSENRGFDANQGARFLLGPNIPKREKFAKWPQAIPNGHKSYQMAIKYQFKMVIKYTNIFHSKIDQNWDFLFETNHLATSMPTY